MLPVEPRTGAGADWVTVARIVKPHGLAGEMTVELFTDDPGRFAGVARVFLCAERRAPQPFAVRGARPHQGRVVLRLEGIADLEAARAWVGAEVRLPAAERRPPPPGRYFISDLVGCRVWDREDCVGAVTAITELPGAAPLLVVAGAGGEEILVPFAAAYLRRVDAAAGCIEMELPGGMAGLNEPGSPAQGAQPKARRQPRKPR